MDADSETCVHSNTQQNLPMRRQSQGHSIEWWTTDAAAENSFRCQDPLPSETSSSHEQVRSEKWKMGPTLGVIRTGSQNQRRRMICRMDKWAWKKQRGTQLGFHTEAGTKFHPGSYSDNRNKLFKASPASNVSFTLWVRQESEFIVRANKSWVFLPDVRCMDNFESTTPPSIAQPLHICVAI